MRAFFRQKKPQTKEVEPTVALITEDEPILRLNASDMLEDMGFVVDAAEGAAQALTILERGNVELLITDIHMPGDLDGLALAKEAIERWPALRVVICSGRTRLPADELPPRTKFVSKPYTMDDIEDAILSL